MTLSTTGTLTTVAFDTRMVIDRAYGSLGLTPQQITGEKIQIAQDLLALVLTDLVNTANPLWCLQRVLVTLSQGTGAYTLPVGTSDVQSAYYRTQNNVTPTAFTSTASAYTFDFGLSGAGGNNDTLVSSWSINWAGSAVPVTFQASEDNATWLNVYVSGMTDSAGSGTVWYDMTNSNARRYWRVIPTVVTPPNTLSITSAAVYNTPSEIQMARLNRDDYFNLPNKVFQGRPLQYWLDRQLQPVMNLWPQPDALAQQNVAVVRRQRHIMDVGSLQQAIEVPTRWFYTIIFALGDALGFVTPEAHPDRVALVQSRAQQMLKTTWTEERDKSPFRMQFSLRQYTR